MRPWRYIKTLDTMKRITRQELSDNFDEILEQVDKENIGYVILTENGEDGHVLCPADWVRFMFDRDFGLVVVSAVRYSIDRPTFMQDHVVDFVKKYIKVLDTSAIKAIIEEINFHIEGESTSQPNMWKQLRDELSIRLQSLLESEEIPR